jgi:hypothetical protein
MTDLVATRKSLHGVAELLLAGPQHARSATIRLTPSDGGFATTAEPAVRVVQGALVHDGRTVPLHGLTAAGAAAAVGLTPCSLDDLYRDGSGIGVDDELVVDDGAAAEIAAAFAAGAAGLAAFAPGESAVLWPEHFDLGLSLDEVNYGVSPGDDHIDVPYAYVGPWTPREGPFWNTSFGAARPLSEINDLAAWFAEGAEHARNDKEKP